MWHLNLEKVRATLAAAGLPTELGSLAIETGTLRGAGALTLARDFPRVITMELSAEIFSRAEARLRSHRTIRCLQGNSAELLPAVLRGEAESGAGADSPAEIFFFLDAHWSGDTSVDWSGSRWKGYGFDTAHLGEVGSAPSGPQQVPLAEEFAAIRDYCVGPAVILVDDAKNLPEAGAGARDFEFPGEDWSHLSRESLRGVLGPRLIFEAALSDPAQWLLVLRARD